MRKLVRLQGWSFNKNSLPFRVSYVTAPNLLVFFETIFSTCSSRPYLLTHPCHMESAPIPSRHDSLVFMKEERRGRNDRATKNLNVGWGNCTRTQRENKYNTDESIYNAGEGRFQTAGRFLYGCGNIEIQPGSDKKKTTCCPWITVFVTAVSSPLTQIMF